MDLSIYNFIICILFLICEIFTPAKACFASDFNEYIPLIVAIMTGLSYHYHEALLAQYSIMSIFDLKACV